MRFSWASLLWAEQPHLSPPLPKQQTLQSSNTFLKVCHWTPVYLCLTQHSSTPDVPHQSWAERKVASLRPAGNALPKASQDAASHLCKDIVTSHMNSLPTRTSRPCLLPASQSPMTCVKSVKLQHLFHINSPHPSAYLHSHSQKIHMQAADSPSLWQTPKSAQSLTHCIELSQNATSVTPERSFSWGETSTKFRSDMDQKISLT